MALPISALSTLLRTEASGVLAAVSPHCATTAPRCTTITAVVPICCVQASAFASFSRDHPATSGSTWSQPVSGKRSASAGTSGAGARLIEAPPRAESATARAAAPTATGHARSRVRHLLPDRCDGGIAWSMLASCAGDLAAALAKFHRQRSCEVAGYDKWSPQGGEEPS